MTIQRAILLLASGLVIAANQPPPPPADLLDPYAGPQAKSVVVEIEFQGPAEVRVISTEVVYGTSRSNAGGPEMYRVRVMDQAGDLANEFYVWDPLILDVSGSGRHVRSRAVGHVVFPYKANLKELELIDLRLTDSATGQPGRVVARADLEPAIIDFCIANPLEGGCRERKETADLDVLVEGPSNAEPGDDIGRELYIRVRNVGSAPAVAFAEEGEEPPTIMVDVVLSSDEELPIAFARYSESFHEDVLLGGGRESLAETVRSGDVRVLELSAVIPEAHPGIYCLGVVVDPGNVLAEDSEGNNTACHWLRIGPPEEH